MKVFKFEDIVLKKVGFLRGPFGGDLKKEIFVSKAADTYKVYEQGVVLQKDPSIGKYYISSNYFHEKMSRFEIKPNDFLVSCSGVNYGAIFQLKGKVEKGVINQALLRIRLNNEIIDDDYFLYLFRVLIVNMIVGKKGDSTIPNFPPLNVIKELKFKLPELSIQKKIGRILSSLDAKIELNNRINAELEAMAKTLYDYWFVQFEFPSPPVEGCPKDGVGYKSSGGKMVWNEQLRREIPAGWEVKKLADWIDKTKSGDWGSDIQEGNYKKKVICFRGADINGLNGVAELNPPVRYILEKNENKILSSHDLIIEISGGSPTQSTGRLAFISNSTLGRFCDPLICSNFCKAITLKDSKLMYNFSYLWNSLYENGAFFGYEGKTSGIKNLLFDSFVNSYWSVFPDEKIIEKFYSFMEIIQEKKQKALAENQHLASLRDWLLPMLMNGQISVGAAEKAIYRVEEELRLAAEPE